MGLPVNYSVLIHTCLIIWLIFMPVLCLVLPAMEIRYTELVIELLLLFVCLFIYYRFTKFQIITIQLGWAFFCSGIALDVIDEIVDTSSIVHVNAEDLVVMLGIALVAIGVSRESDRLLQVVARSRRQSDHYRGLAQTDALTGLANREKFQNALEFAIDKAKLSKELVAVIFIDLNQFKPANDTYGHDIGDQLLQAVAARLKGVVRSTDLLCRWGGDEFLIFQQSITDPKVSEDLANRIYSAFDNQFQVNEHNITLGASIGYAIFPQDAQTYKELIKLADLSMYQAKKLQCKPVRFKRELLAEVAVKAKPAS